MQFLVILRKIFMFTSRDQGRTTKKYRYFSIQTGNIHIF